MNSSDLIIKKAIAEYDAVEKSQDIARLGMMASHDEEAWEFIQALALQPISDNFYIRWGLATGLTFAASTREKARDILMSYVNLKDVETRLRIAICLPKLVECEDVTDFLLTIIERLADDENSLIRNFAWSARENLTRIRQSK